MSHSFNNEAGVKAQQKLGTSQSEVEFQLNAERIKQNKDKAKKNAVFLAEVEQLAGILLDGSQSAEGSAESNAKSGNSKGKKQQKFGGEDFYVDNCIPFKMFVEMMKQRLQQANLQAGLGQTLALAYAGVNKSVDADGNCTFSKEEGGGIANQICNAIIESGNDQANQTSIAGYGDLSQGVATMGTAVVMAKMCGDSTEEENTVNKMKNVVAEDKNISVNSIAQIGNKTEDEGVAGKTDPNDIDRAALSEAIGKMADGGYDFNEENHHFGSKKTSTNKTIFQGKSLSKILKTTEKIHKYTRVTKEDRGIEERKLTAVVNNNLEADDVKRISVRNVLQHATRDKRAAISKNIRFQLKQAKDALKAKEASVLQKQQAYNSMLTAVGKAGAGGLTISSALSITAKAQDDATKSKFDTAQTTMNKLNSDQSDATKKARERTDSANQDLQSIIRTVGQRA